MATDEHDIGGETARPWRNFYGRRHGKRMSDHQQDLLETRLEALAPAGVGWAENPGRTPLDPAALVPGAEDLWLEIGFGGGEHMIATAEAHPEIGLIGCEPYVNGVAKLLSAIERAHGGQGLANLRLHAGDARDLMDVLPAGAIGRVYLLYPDPWPKTRHVKRRFLREENLDLLARAMAPGAELRVASDIDDYIKTSLIAVRRHPDFEWMATRADDWRKPWDGWIRTRYEQKALREGRTPTYLRIRRR